GVAVIVLGILLATALFLRGRWPGGAGMAGFQSYRHNIGRAILLGLEILVAADIIQTVAVEPTFQSVGVLAIIVLVRTFLSFTLELELEGRWPWQRRRTEDVFRAKPEPGTER
ncbi:MAG: DUF1622 domain-containing protein, partial [Chloroflexi bacterium]|nr:DUF1622 domain-containing protein [Chloroflexota bacterium]MCI0728177.1 DUF1622 domain-containing protein [Chloroflexota bacterium]